MSTDTATTEKKPTASASVSARAKLSRDTLKRAGRQKRRAKLLGDKEFAKTFFAAKSKRSTEKKAAFRKKKKNKK